MAGEKIPEYRVTRLGEPIAVEGIRKGGGGMTPGLSQIVVVEPGCDIPGPGFLTFAQLPSESSVIRPLLKPADDVALLFEVSAVGEQASAERNLDQTIANMDTLFNPWRDPEAFIQLIYSHSGRA